MSDSQDHQSMLPQADLPGRGNEQSGTAELLRSFAPGVDNSERPARIRDVAAACAVSVTTDSNVLNNPELVETSTRELVYGTIAKLNYVPNRHAVALRKGSQAKPSSAEDAGRRLPEPTQCEDRAPVRTQAQSTRENSRADWEHFSPGDKVQVVRMGMQERSAMIDAVMPDRSVLWILMNNGMGRTMVLQTDDIELLPPDV